jgi:type I restriction enzyme S subunit
MSHFSEIPLPPTWDTAPIGKVAEINPGLNKSEIDDRLAVAFVPMPAVEAESGRIDVSATCLFGEVKKGYTAFCEGDVLFAKITPCMENGKMAIVPALRNGLGFGSTEFHVLRPREGISAQYLYYFVSAQQFRRDAEHNMTGAVGQRRVPTPYLAQHTIPIPPEPEQRRIVAKIEELFSELDKGVESLTTAREQLEFYRLVILHQALIDRDGVTFPTHPLSELIGEIGQGWSPKCDVNTPARDGEWAIIKTTAVQPMSYLGHECKPLPDDLKPRPSIEINDGDLLMTRKGPRPRTGVVCHVRKARPKSMLCDTVYRFRAREELVFPEYLEIALNAPTVVQELNARKSGISESGISLNHGKLQSLRIPIPSSLADQAHIVQTVRERMSLVEHQCALVAEQIQLADVLRQAILKRAFSGQLLAQDAADEPASVQLERIRAQREESGTPKRRNNKNNKKEAA